MSNYNPQQNKKQTVDLASAIFGQVTPQDKGAEEAVLGACLLGYEDGIEIALGQLDENSFHFEANQLLFCAIRELVKVKKPVDLVTVADVLKNSKNLENIGGAYYLIELTNKVGSSANIEAHCRILIEKALKRKLIELGTSATKSGFDDTADAFDAMEDYQKKGTELDKIVNQSTKIETLESVGIQLINDLDTLQDGQLTGVPTGFTDFDRLTNGLQGGEVAIFAARPSMGKTTVALNMARNAAKSINPKTGQKRGVAIFCYEATKKRLTQRLALAESRVPSDQVKGIDFLTPENRQKYIKGIEDITGLKIYIFDISDRDNDISTVAKAARICKRLKKEGLIDEAIFDYLQLMNVDTKHGTEEQRVAAVSRELTVLALTLDIPVVALSQLSRAVETRGGNKKPQLSDLRHSGAIEQDAQIIAFIYRPEYYDILETVNGESTKGLTQLLVQKNRDGALGDVDLDSDLSTYYVCDRGAIGHSEQSQPNNFNNNIITRESAQNPEDADLPF